MAAAGCQSCVAHVTDGPETFEKTGSVCVAAVSLGFAHNAVDEVDVPGAARDGGRGGHRNEIGMLSVVQAGVQ